MRACLLVIALAGCGGGARSAPGVVGPPPSFADPWVTEEPQLDALFPGGELVSVTEHWERTDGGFRHCYAAEAPAQEGERERFAREAEQLGYRLGETPMGSYPTFTADGVSAVQMLAVEDALAGRVDAMMDQLGEPLERTVTVRVCVDHPTDEGAARAAAFRDAVELLAPVREPLASHAGPLRQVRYTVTSDGPAASLVHAFEGDSDSLGAALAARGFRGDAPTWTRGILTVQLLGDELTATAISATQSSPRKLRCGEPSPSCVIRR